MLDAMYRFFVQSELSIVRKSIALIWVPCKVPDTLNGYKKLNMFDNFHIPQKQNFTKIWWVFRRCNMQIARHDIPYMYSHCTQNVNSTHIPSMVTKSSHNTKRKITFWYLQKQCWKITFWIKNVSSQCNLEFLILKYV